MKDEIRWFELVGLIGAAILALLVFWLLVVLSWAVAG